MRSREVLAVDDRWTYEPFLIDKSALIHLIFGSLCMELGGIGQVQPRTTKLLRAGSYGMPSFIRSSSALPQVGMSYRCKLQIFVVSCHAQRQHVYTE